MTNLEKFVNGKNAEGTVRSTESFAVEKDVRHLSTYYKFKIGRAMILGLEVGPMKSNMRIIKVVFQYQLEGEEHWYNNQANVPLDGEDTQVAISALREFWLGRTLTMRGEEKKKVVGFRLYQALVMAEADTNPYPKAITS
jgi:hypothetical protein